ncbi:chromosome-associated kinesin KIF4 [Trichonephila clavipes]|nr:chromosome-associated kinesin KIF4 [Trichonephila clavipes]
MPKKDSFGVDLFKNERNVEDDLYREEIFDLLQKSATPCSLREEPDGIKVIGLTEVPVKSVEDAFVVLEKGSHFRHTSTTAKNLKSSRSHAIFSVYIEQSNNVNSKRSKFQLVDLAGSERMGFSKTVGLQVKEGININLGLLSLGKVITHLIEEKQHIPYRDSKLTRLLQDSLGGNSHTVMIACVNPSASCTEETLSTLRYASNTRRIKNRPVVNIDSPTVQIEKLKKQLESIGGIKFPCCQLSCLLPKWEVKTIHVVSFVPALLKTLEENLKRQPVYQDSLKDALSDLSLEIELAIPFAPNQDPQDIPQQLLLSEVVHYPSE